MIDNRIYTFLKLCEVMNYRKTATLLNMTQPAVTQHIQALENMYKCKLFNYEGKVLSKTEQAIKLEEYARSVVYNEKSFKERIFDTDKVKISFGATKTVGDYVINEAVLNILQDNAMQVNFIVDNTKHLFEQLNTFELDFLMIEGYFDKSKYDYRLIRNEELVGICSKDHKFANKSVTLEEIFKEHVILREQGSGTRNVLSNFLNEKNSSFEQFEKTSTISSFALIQQAVEKNIAISFVYAAIPLKNDSIATFRIKNNKIFHELNCVFLKNTQAFERIAEVMDKI
ncbi:MAG: LysR family transcriptional regulator [Clostridia bacterium]